jgi:hypothetical protein
MGGLRFEGCKPMIIKVLQTSVLPLGYAAAQKAKGESETEFFACRLSPFVLILERETRFELATSTLARSHSTTELLPLAEE